MKIKKFLAERGFDPRTSGLWAQHASAAPLCCVITPIKNIFKYNVQSILLLQYLITLCIKA